MLTDDEAGNSIKNLMKKCLLIMRKLREFNEKDAGMLTRKEKRMWMSREWCRNDTERLTNVREFTKYSYTIAWKDDLKMFQTENLVKIPFPISINGPIYRRN